MRNAQADPMREARASAHPVKTERHDLAARIHHTNTGPRAVERYDRTPHGLYVARRFVDHPRVAYWQAHLLPGVLPHGLGLQVCRYDFHGPRQHDFYLDVAHIGQAGNEWRVRDLYLDVTVYQGLRAELLDMDELLAAHGAGYLDTGELHRALEGAARVLNGLGQHGYQLDGWLGGLGVQLEWQSARQPERELALAWGGDS